MSTFKLGAGVTGIALIFDAVMSGGEGFSFDYTIHGNDPPPSDTPVPAALRRGATVKLEVRTFVTTTTGLLALADWLASEGCTEVAMEATGVYWKPVWRILSDGDFTLLLANARHVKNVTGANTDVNDATWLADVLAHGLIRGSFVPGAEIQVLRNLLRTRKQLVREKSSISSDFRRRWRMRTSSSTSIPPFRTAIELLTTIPGISELSARIIAAEIGNDMSLQESTALR